MIHNEVIKHIYDLTGINVNTKSRKREIVEMKALYSTILRNKNQRAFRQQTFQSIGNAIGLGHCSILHLCNLYKVIKNDYLSEIEQKVYMLLSGMTLEFIELQNEKIKFEINKIKETEKKIDPFFEKLIKLAEQNADVMFKLETFYKINNQIYNKNES